MTRARRVRDVVVTVLGMTVLCASSGCTDLGIGRACLDTSDGGVSGTTVNSAALECPTQLCLLEPPVDSTQRYRATCTAACRTDADCANAVTSSDTSQGQCASSFVCAVAAVAGAEACRMLCVCKDDLTLGMNSDADGGVQCPHSCQDPDTGQCRGLLQ